MRRALALWGALACSFSLAGFGAAQDVPSTVKAQPASPKPAAGSSTVVVAPAVAGAPAIKVPADAVVPDEGAPPKAETSKPVVKAEAPPPAPKPDAPPMKRPRFDSAILQGVDKITAETLRFEAKVGQPVRYKGLILTVHACETTAPDEEVQDSIAHLDVVSQPVSAGRATGPARQVFRGWMYANGPALHPFENSIYDLWLIACKTSSPKA